MTDLTVPIDDGLLNIRVGAIIMRDQKILMVGNEHSDYLYSVGGRVKFGETTEEAVIREVYEETGIKMEVDRLGYVHENFFLGDSTTNLGKKYYEISFFYFMKVPSDFEPVCNSFTEDDQKEHIKWISIDSNQKYFPEFFRDELKDITEGVKHFVTKDI